MIGFCVSPSKIATISWSTAVIEVLIPLVSDNTAIRFGEELVLPPSIKDSSFINNEISGPMVSSGAFSLIPPTTISKFAPALSTSPFSA